MVSVFIYTCLSVYATRGELLTLAMADFNSVVFYYYPGEMGQDCANCDQRFMDHRLWVQHMDLKHAGKDKLYLCQTCGGRFPSIGSILTHYVHCVKILPPSSPMSFCQVN